MADAIATDGRQVSYLSDQERWCSSIEFFLQLHRFHLLISMELILIPNNIILI